MQKGHSPKKGMSLLLVRIMRLGYVVVVLAVSPSPYWLGSMPFTLRKERLNVESELKPLRLATSESFGRSVGGRASMMEHASVMRNSFTKS